MVMVTLGSEKLTSLKFSELDILGKQANASLQFSRVTLPN